MNRVLASAFAVGLLFATGLGVSGMTQPAKVLAFLNPFGGWDPSLGLVMAGAIVAHLATWGWVVGRDRPLFAPRFLIPTRTDINPRLVGGAALFGIGWGLAGVCPGPGLVTLSTGAAEAFVFVASMSAGMQLFHVVETALDEQRAALEPPLVAENVS